MNLELDCLADTATRRTRTVDGAVCHYRELGQGPLLVLLPGTIGNEMLFCRVQALLAQKIRTLVIDHPRVKTVDEAVDILASFFHAFATAADEQFYLGGSSVGGWIAQHFAERFPDRIRGLVVGNSFCDNAILRKRNLGAYRLSALIPERLLLPRFAAGNGEAVARFPGGGEIAAYFSRVIGSLGKSGLRRRLHWSLEKRARPRIVASLPKLIIYTEDDPVIQDEVTLQLIENYADAQVAKLPVGGHFPYLTAPEAYAVVVENFISRSNQ